MTNINAAAAQARENARNSDGTFGTQYHSAPSAFAPVAARSEFHYEPELVVSGHVPDQFGDSLATAVVWAVGRGSNPEDIAAVRAYAGPMSDGEFAELYSELEAFEQQLQMPGDGGSGGTFDWGRWVDRAEAAYAAGSGPASEYRVVSGEGSEGYMGGGKFVGGKYEETKSMPEREVGKMLRQDLKEAQRQGYLPKNVKVSVRQRGGYVTGWSIGVQVPRSVRDGMPMPWDDSEQFRSGGASVDVSTSRAITDRVQLIADQYSARDVNSMVDYFNVHRDSSVYVEVAD